MVINGIHAQIESLAVDTQKQCNQLFSQHTVDMNILMLYVFLVSCERRYRVYSCKDKSIFSTLLKIDYLQRYSYIKQAIRMQLPRLFAECST